MCGPVETPRRAGEVRDFARREKRRDAIEVPTIKFLEEFPRDALVRTDRTNTIADHIDPNPKNVEHPPATRMKSTPSSARSGARAGFQPVAEGEALPLDTAH